MGTLISVCQFYMQFAWIGVETADRFYLDVHGPSYGEFTVNMPADDFGKGLRCDWGFSPERIMNGLRYARRQTGYGNGETKIWAGGTVVYRKGTENHWHASRNEKTDQREKVDCLCLNAIMDYLDHGDDADLCAAIDMLTDAGKFDPE